MLLQGNARLTYPTRAHPSKRTSPIRNLKATDETSSPTGSAGTLVSCEGPSLRGDLETHETPRTTRRRWARDLEKLTGPPGPFILGLFCILSIWLSYQSNNLAHESLVEAKKQTLETKRQTALAEWSAALQLRQYCEGQRNVLRAARQQKLATFQLCSSVAEDVLQLPPIAGSGHEIMIPRPAPKPKSGLRLTSQLSANETLQHRLNGTRECIQPSITIPPSGNHDRMEARPAPFSREAASLYGENRIPVSGIGDSDVHNKLRPYDRHQMEAGSSSFPTEAASSFYWESRAPAPGIKDADVHDKFRHISKTPPPPLPQIPVWGVELREDSESTALLFSRPLLILAIATVIYMLLVWGVAPRKRIRTVFLRQRRSK